jgi:hypothetical protein
MTRPYGPWWLKYPAEHAQRAEQLLAQYTSAVERNIRHWEHNCPGEVDWAPVFWDAAYRAAWRCDGQSGFWPLLKLSMLRASRKYLATHRRRTAKLLKMNHNGDLEVVDHRMSLLDVHEAKRELELLE